MTINISTGLKNKLLASPFASRRELVSTTISFGDGDGTGGRDTINDASGLDVFTKHSFISLLPPDGNPNRNILAKVLSSSATQLEVAADTLTVLTAGPQVIIQEPDIAGSFASIFRNCTIHFFNEQRPVSADDAEPGTPILKVTLNGAAFTPGLPENGLNFGDMVNSVLRRAIDPETAAQEVWKGTPTQSIQANSARVYANDVITGTSPSAIRFDCVVSSKNAGGDIELDPNNVLSTKIEALISSVRVELKATALA